MISVTTNWSPNLDLSPMPSAAGGPQDPHVQPTSLALDSASSSILDPITVRPVPRRGPELQLHGDLHDRGDAAPSGVGVNHVRFAEAPP